MVNKSLRTIDIAISDGVRSVEVCVVPLVVLITYKYVRCRHWFHFSWSITVAQTVTAANRRTQTFLPTTCYTLYKNINAIFRRNSRLVNDCFKCCCIFYSDTFYRRPV